MIAFFVVVPLFAVILWFAGAAVGMRSRVVQRYRHIIAAGLGCVALVAVPCCLLAEMYAVWLVYVFSIVWCFCLGLLFGIAVR